MAGRIRVQPFTGTGIDWRVSNVGADSVQATATRVACPKTGAGPKRNVCTGITVTIAAGAAAPTAASVTVAVIDGASGASVYLWGPIALSIPGIAGGTNGAVVIPMYEVGSEYTPMTIEFSAGAGASTVESVWMSGTTE